MKPTTNDVLEQQIASGVLHSERLRATILAVVFTTAGPLVVGILHFGAEVFDNPSSEILARLQGVIVGALLFLVAYAWFVRAFIDRAIRRGTRPSRVLRFANALVEVTLVTTVVLLFARVADPMFALTSPPTHLYFVFITLSILSLDVATSVFMGVVAGLQYTAAALLLLAEVDGSAYPRMFTTPLPIFIKALLFAGGGIVAGLVGREVRRRLVHALEAVAEKQRAVEMFGEHVSPKVAAVLLEHRGDFPGELRHVCVMFLDIRDFTRFSEQRSPAEVVSFLDTLFDPLVEIVNRHGGIVNKFLGDGFMAVFGAPVAEDEPCKSAVKAALAIVAEVRAMVEAKRIPNTRVGIGLHAGEAVTGTIGSRSRKEYTVIGDTVNLASRVEQLTKALDAQVLVSESVWEKVQGEGFVAEAETRTKVKGREAEVAVYKLG